jgi:type III secretion system low calcium response chaperone LcrH/SycD
MQGEQQQIKQAAGQVGGSAKESAAGNVDKAVKQATKGGKSMKDILGLTDVMVEGMYGQAYRLYYTGKYRDASQIFRMLLMISPSEVKYAMGFAACFHMLKEYKGAAAAYSLVSSMDPNSPVPFYHASDCYIKLGDPFSAIVALEMAIKNAGTKPEFRSIKDRASMTIEGLKTELGIKEKTEKTEEK